MSDPLSNFWGKLKGRSRRFAAADQTDEQTHMNHALVMVLLFGTIGAGLALLAGRSRQSGLEIGIVVGWSFYLLREIHQRLYIAQWIVGEPRWLRWLRIPDPTSVRFEPRFRLWDGVCDILIPLWITAPIIAGSVELLWALSVLVALAYFVFRPLDDGGAV